MLRSIPCRAFGAACLLALFPACHDHEATASGSSTTVLPPGSSGPFNLIVPDGMLRRGESFNCEARESNGANVPIQTWELRDIDQSPLPPNTGTSLAVVSFFDTSRCTVGEVRDYALRAQDFQGRVSYYRFSVETDAYDLRVNDVIQGDDQDDVQASLACVGTDTMFLAELVGDTSAPQNLVRINRAGTRLLTVTVPYKVEDLSVDRNSNIMVIRQGATLTDALVRLDENFVESTTFSAPDIAPNQWRDLVAQTPDGNVIAITDHNGGSLLYLNEDGSLAGPTLASSLIPLPLPYDEIVDVTFDNNNWAYIATETTIARHVPTGGVDTMFWSPDTQTAIRNVATDERGVLFVSLQDADGGQCGSLRRIDWRGTEVRRITDFDSGGVEFAARKILDPEALGVFSDGAWRIYDDIVVLDPNVPRAAWILRGEPIAGNGGGS